MVKRKTVRKVYKKSRRKIINRISRKTKTDLGGGKNSKKGIRTFKKKYAKKIKRTKKRKLNIQIRNNRIHVNKTVRIGNFKLRPGNKLNFLPQDRKYQEGGMVASIKSLFRKDTKVAPSDNKIDTKLPLEDTLKESDAAAQIKQKIDALAAACAAEFVNAKKEVSIPEDALQELEAALDDCADEGKGKATYRGVPSEVFVQELAAMKKWEPLGGAGDDEGGLWVSNETCDDLVMGTILGHGASGVVSKATYRGKEVAVKELNFKENNLDELRSVVKEFKAEVEIMGNLKHPNLVQLKGYCTKGDKYKFKVVLELIDGGTLYDTLHEKRVFNDKELLQYALDVAMGMEYLHSFQPPILHRDLKSPNIMVGKTDNILKITDFGLARTKSVDSDMKTQVMTQAGTPYWSAPEVLSGKIYNESADVYSAAMVFYEIWARKVPFNNMDPMAVNVQVTTKNNDGEFLRPDLEADSNKVNQPCPIIDLVKSMWDDDPKLRPRFTKICDSILAVAKNMDPLIELRVNRNEEIEVAWVD